MEQYIGQLMTNFEFQNMFPDTTHSVITSGYGVFGLTNYVSCASAIDGHVTMVYFPTNQTATMNLGSMSCVIRARWFDPTTGFYSTAGSGQYNPYGSVTFTPPTNASNAADEVLVFDPQPNTTAVIAKNGTAVNLTVK